MAAASSSPLASNPATRACTPQTGRPRHGDGKRRRSAGRGSWPGCPPTGEGRSPPARLPCTATRRRSVRLRAAGRTPWPSLQRAPIDNHAALEAFDRVASGACVKRRDQRVDDEGQTRPKNLARKSDEKGKG